MRVCRHEWSEGVCLQRMLVREERVCRHVFELVSTRAKPRLLPITNLHTYVHSASNVWPIIMDEPQ